MPLLSHAGKKVQLFCPELLSVFSNGNRGGFSGMPCNMRSKPEFLPKTLKEGDNIQCFTIPLINKTGRLTNLD